MADARRSPRRDHDRPVAPYGERPSQRSCRQPDRRPLFRWNGGDRAGRRMADRGGPGHPLALRQQRPFARHSRPEGGAGRRGERSEEHTSELQSLMRTSYAVFCLKKKKKPLNMECKKNTIHKKRQTTKIDEPDIRHKNKKKKKTH